MSEEASRLFKHFMQYEEDYIKKTETRAELLEEVLLPFGFREVRIPVLAPSWEYWLKIGNREVKALPTALKSGYVGPYLKDSSDLEDYNRPNVNFNSQLSDPNAISTPVFYNAPSLAISRRDASEALLKGFEGYVKVTPKVVTARNFVVGDIEKANAVVVSHYDALWYGAVDNTSGLVASLVLMKRLKNVAFLFLGYTEVTLTNDYSRFVIEKVAEELRDELRGKEVIVLDCLGFEGSGFIDDPEYVEAYSPLKPAKIYGTPMERLIKIYHSTIDRELDLDKLLSDIKEVYEYLRSLESS